MENNLIGQSSASESMAQDEAVKDPATQRVDILKQIQNLCQDEENYFEFERVLKDYVEEDTPPSF